MPTKKKPTKKTKPKKAFKERVDAELDRFANRMVKLGVHPLCVAALWLEPGKVEGKPLGATICIAEPGDSGMERDFLHQNAVYGLHKLAELLIEKHPEFFKKLDKSPAPPAGKVVN